MFCTTRFPLLCPATKEIRFVDDLIRFRGPNSERFAPRAVNSRQAAQFPELLRELWDFR